MKSIKVMLFLLLSLIAAAHSRGRKNIHCYSNTIVVHQKSKKRYYVKNIPKLIKRISLESTFDSTVYKPNFCRFDNSGSVYMIDYSTFYIHKFSPITSTNSYSHSYFGNVSGEGPGELVRPVDLEIYDGKLFIVDEARGCIVVHTTEGKHVKDIRLSDYTMPRKITIISGKMIIEPMQYHKNELFHVYDINGKFLYSFGNYIDNKNVNNGIYHDNYILKYSENRFLYTPLYLGIIGLYEGKKLILAKNTIDGFKEVKTIKKEVIKGLYAKKIDKKYITANGVACNDKHIVLSAVELNYKEGNKWFCDIYDKKNLDYVGSVQLPEYSTFFDIQGNLYAGISKGYLYIFDMTSVLSGVG